MDLSRRRLATYGKSNRRAVVHDLFNVTQKEPRRFSASTPPSDESADVSTNAGPSRQLAQELTEAADASTKLDSRHKKVTKDTKLTNNAKRTKLTRLSQSRGPPSPKAIRRTISSKSRAKESEVEDSGSLSGSLSHTLRPSLALSSPEPSSSQETLGEPTSPKSEKSSVSMASARSTPKRKRQIDEDTASDLSSPSRLELSSLLLSPKQHRSPRARSGDTQATGTASRPPSNPRQRLVDHIDSPPQSQLSLTDASDDQPRPKKSRKLLTSTESRHGLSDLQRPTRALQADPRRTEGNTLAQPPTRLRTYGRQRSHLKDMVASKDSGASSQAMIQELVSQVEALTAAKSQFEIEDESDDDERAVKPKSIHELRHGGLADRFNMDLDSLFEDIDSGNKSLRIQSLMSLVRKLQEKTFKAHLLASGKLGRLTQVAVPHLDLSSAMLILLALWALCVDETATCQSLVQIYGCLLHLPSTIVTERRALHQIAKDGKENLSKALIRDVADFEQHVIDKSVQKGSRARCIVVSRVGVQCLSFTLRRIITLEGQPQDPPVAFLRSAILCIRRHLADMASTGERLDQIESIRLLMSWLERTAVTTSANISHAGIVEELGALLDDVMRWASKQHAALEQSSIRTVVELSNRDAPVCRGLASTPLLETLFAVVVQHFARLESRPQDGAHPDQSEKLDSAILALGCLLNFAEYSPEVRLKMAAEGQVDRLVNYFNVFADQVDEAITEELTQTLGVPFGYLCLLLCALCLNSSNREHISSAIKGDGLNPLWLEAETCLHHMKIIDNDGFTDRFNAMLDRVKSMSTG
ncbi:hypothetical protein DV736_g2842, partial [Chaetothyriales sp. CBS 134916]